jgi:hypothetical protein
VSPDGNWILYLQYTNDGQTLMRLSIDGGHPEPLITGPIVGEFRCGLQRGSRCVLRSVENDQFIFYELDPVRGKGRELARTVWSPTILADWDISPDGRTVAIPNHDPRNAIIRTVALTGSSVDMPEGSVTLEGLKGLNGLVWAADGRGWYVCARAPAGWVLSFVDLEGRSSELLQLPTTTYAVPSPDGRRIGFPQFTISSNVFMMDGLR